MCSTKAAGDAPAVPVFKTRAQQLEKMPPCQAQCPNTGDIRGWIGIIAQHEKNGLTLEEAYDQAWQKLADRNPLPATISRICPHPCEDLCTRSDKDGAVSINALERFLGDWGISRSLPLPGAEAERHPESIGVVGSGPASLSFAYQMVRRGYEVTIYERQSQPGGMLRHAIPDYRLPRQVLEAEVERLLDLDIRLESNTDIGNTLDLEDLRERHGLIFLGLGAQGARRLGIPGEEGPGVDSGIEFLRRRKQQPASLMGKKVVVIGGGNTAIDAARGALRDGARVTLVYRRSEAEMPAASHEVADARAEGVVFRFLLAPTRILRKNGKVRYVTVQAMRLDEADSSGRRRPVPLAGVTQDIRADLVLVAVAQAPDWRGMGAIAVTRDWLEATEAGRLDDGIWAGGDDRGPGLASAAIAQGRYAAEAAHAELRGLPRPQPEHRDAVNAAAVKTGFFADRERHEVPRRPSDEWLTDPEAEIDLTIDAQQAIDEASRCMSCGLCFDCQQCFMYCNRDGFTRIEETSPGNYFALALDACEGCGKCIEICPCGFLEAREE
ncbi:MAG: FAD-dependent oxidoreductase [Gammaproteobacteria bacterium]|nr:FAD-dependent oxidoreductase [Gammaproteobacteria bacterium]